MTAKISSDYNLGWMVISSGLLNSSCFSFSFNRCSSSYRDSSNEGTDNRGMVDDVVGGVGGGVLLDSDLGYMVDLVVDLVTNMVDNRGSGNVDSRSSNMVVGNRGNSNGRGGLDLDSLDSSNSRSSSLDLDSLDSSNCRGSNMVGSRGNSNCGSRCNTSVVCKATT